MLPAGADAGSTAVDSIVNSIQVTGAVSTTFTVNAQGSADYTKILDTRIMTFQGTNKL
ncbi:MAG: hypothetical protein KKA10_02605 [Euryarchaeota archaeon]|nr:hypothetical protein [Euryarchaeota archaeon]MDP3104843.1 hypothetical protein [Candidatus Methanoperedens sp.]